MTFNLYKNIEQYKGTGTGKESVNLKEKILRETLYLNEK